jgi:hypothetical protein
MGTWITSGNRFIDNIELWLSGAGIVVILGVPYLLDPSPNGFWKVAAITAIGVGLLHGVIFWVIRRRQRMIRQRSINEIRGMLTDVVKNKLSIIEMYLPNNEEQAVVEEQLEGIHDSIEQISEHVDTLSEEAIDDWKTKYDGPARQTVTMGTAGGQAGGANGSVTES